jgi:hypothetical protein
MGSTNSIPSWCCSAAGWNVTIDNNNFINMVPLAEHKRTLIFLPGLTEYNYVLFKEMFMDRSGVVPKDFKIIIP